MDIFLPANKYIFIYFLCFMFFFFHYFIFFILFLHFISQQAPGIYIFSYHSKYRRCFFYSIYTCTAYLFFPRIFYACLLAPTFFVIIFLVYYIYIDIYIYIVAYGTDIRFMPFLLVWLLASPRTYLHSIYIVYSYIDTHFFISFSFIFFVRRFFVCCLLAGPPTVHILIV